MKRARLALLVFKGRESSTSFIKMGIILDCILKCVCVCVCACVRACVRACVCPCVSVLMFLTVARVGLCCVSVTFPGRIHSF